LGLRERINAAGRRRALGAQARTGKYARSFATTRALEWSREFWRPLLLVFVLPSAVFVPVAVFYLRGSLQYAVIGAAAATGLWLAVLSCVLFSGVAAKLVSVVAEQWTAGDLRRLRRRGWRLINGLKFVDQSDIDHVAIGPAGLLVVETKWSADGWDISAVKGFLAQRIQEAVAQVSRDTKQIYGSLGEVRQGTPPRSTLMRPVVVLHSAAAPVISGPGWKEYSYEDWRVTVVHASHFRKWLEALDDGLLGETEIIRLWNTLDKKVRGYESRLGGAPRRTFARLVYEWLAKPCLGAAMALWAVQGVVAEHQLLVELFSWCVAMVAAVAALRVKPIRHVAMGYATVWIFYLLSALVLVLAFGWKL
jgi:hypothetical protein